MKVPSIFFITGLMCGMISVALAQVPVRLLPQAGGIANAQMPSDGGVIPLKNGLKIPLEKPFPIHEGTISAWIRPLNWDAATPEMVHLLRVDGEDCWWRIFKYQVDANKYGLTFVFGRPAADGKRYYTYITAPITDWKKGAWHHVAATWSQKDGVIALYIDGERKAMTGFKEENLPMGDHKIFEVAAPNTKPDGDIFRTAFDLMDLYDEVLPDKAIATLAQSTMKNQASSLDSVPSSVATIPKISHAPKIDGVLSPGEWDAGAQLFGGLTIANPLVASSRTFTIHAAYDEAHLYLMIVSPAADMRLRAETRENGTVDIAHDDVIEVLLAPRALSDYYQFIGNSLGYSYANHGGDHDWHDKWKFANTLFEGFWYAELAIPFSSLGLKNAPAPGSRWKANFCRDWATEAMPVFTTWSFTPQSYFSHMGELIFGEENTGYALTVQGETLASGEIQGELKPLSVSSGQATVLIENSHGIQSRRDLTLAKGKAASFSENLPPGETSNVQIEVGDGEIAFRQPIPVRVDAAIKLTVTPNLSAQTLQIAVNLGQKSDNGKNYTIGIEDSSGKPIVKKEELSVEAGKVSSVFDAKIMPEGRYRIIVSQGDKVLAEQNYDHIADAGWRNWKSSFYGVPHPWTPIKYGDNSLEFWGRTYTLGKGVLPQGLQALHESLLRAPMVLDIVTNGKTLLWNSERVWQSKDPAEGSFVLTAENSFWKAIATVQFEFDGFLWVNLQFEPLREDARMDQMVLSIPFAPGIAKLVYAHNHSRKFVQGELAKDSLGIFYPSIWIGNDDVGLAWATESDQHWNTADSEHVTEFRPDVEGGALLIRMVDKPFSPKGTLHYGFGIQATPVRPLNPLRHVQRIAPTIGSTLAHPWDLDRSVKRYGLEDPEWGFLSPHYTSIDAVKDELQKWREKGLEMPWYIAPDIISPQSTEFQVFRDEWKNPHAVYQFACVNSSFAQFSNREMEDLVEKAGLRAIYVDCAKAYPCGNAAHGCGYRDEEGKLHLTFPIRALRNYLKNLYVSLHEKGEGDGSLILHLSAGRTPIAHGFSDIVLEGEEVQYIIEKTPSYFDLYSPVKWRTVFGKADGINTALLPNYGRVGSKETRMSEKLNATFMTQALLNDTPVWNIWTNKDYVNGIYAALDKLGFQSRETRFEPYWKQTAASAPGTELKISIYRTPDAIILAVGNFTKKAIDGELHLDWQVLGLESRNVEVRNILSNTILSKEHMEIMVPPENFLLLSIRNEQHKHKHKIRP